MERIKNAIFPKPTIVMCIKVLQHMTGILGLNCNKNGFGFNCSSAVFVVVVIWFSGCYVGREFCTDGCNTKFAYKNIVILLLAVRLLQFSVLACIIEFRCSKLAKQIHQLGDYLVGENAWFASFTYRRRNFVISSLFVAWILSKVVQLEDMTDTDEAELYLKGLHYLRYTCAYVNTWPLTVLNWQFLVWMQAYSRCLTISLDELRCATIEWQKAPSNNYELRIYESVTRVKAILRFKEKILRVYGPSIIFGQLRTSLWILLNAYWFSHEKRRSMVKFLLLMFVNNVIMAYLPYWVGQEISSEFSEMLYKILNSQVRSKPLIFNEKVGKPNMGESCETFPIICNHHKLCSKVLTHIRLSNFIFGLLHQSPKFRVFNLFDLTHKQFLSFLSLSIGFLIIQSQMIV